jgi:hypothetical protein
VKRIILVLAVILLCLPAAALAQDATRPEVTATFPENGKNDHDVDHPVRVYFSEDMDPASINNNTFYLTNLDAAAFEDEEVEGTVSYITADRMAEFVPDSNFDYNTRYRATVTIGVRDLAGNHLAEDYIFEFITRKITGESGSGGGGCFIMQLVK